MAKRKLTAGETVGSILAGWDQAVFRTSPPAREMVEHARPDQPAPAEDGGVLVVRLPPMEDEPRRGGRRDDSDENGCG